MMLAVARVAVRLAYPALILGSWHWEAPRLMGLLLLALLWLQRVLGGGLVGSALRRMSPLDWSVAVALSAASCVIALTGDERLLRLYPAFVNMGLLVAFAATLRRGPSMIERFARLQTPDLDLAGQVYTRRVTALWCVFFVANGGFSVYTACSWTVEAWALYNGAIAYLLTGTLLLGEWLYRRFVVRPPGEESRAAREPGHRDGTVGDNKGGARA